LQSIEKKFNNSSCDHLPIVLLLNFTHDITKLKTKISYKLQMQATENNQRPAATEATYKNMSSKFAIYRVPNCQKLQLDCALRERKPPPRHVTSTGSNLEFKSRFPDKSGLWSMSALLLPKCVFPVLSASVISQSVVKIGRWLREMLMLINLKSPSPQWWEKWSWIHIRGPNHHREVISSTDW